MRSGLSPVRRPTRLLGPKRMSVLHSRAGVRMRRRSAIYYRLADAEGAASLLGMLPLARRNAIARKVAKQLYDEARSLEEWLWEHYPDCDLCRGTGRAEVNGRDMECPQCEGQKKDRRG